MGLDIRQALAYTPQQRQRLAERMQDDSSARQQGEQILVLAEQRLTKQPHPLPVIYFEGLLNTDERRVETSRCLMDMDDLALLNDAYAISSRQDIAEAIRAYVLAWANTYQPTGNPINERKLEAVLYGYDLLRSHWSIAESSAVEEWMKHIAKLEIQSGHDRPQSTRNNWHTKRLCLVGAIGIICNQPELIAYAVDGYRPYLEAGLLPDGSSVDFHQRDALSYHQSGLKPLVVLARMMRRSGVDLWPIQAENGASTPRSIDWLIPWVDGSQVHAEWVNTTVQLDRRRAEAGIPFYQTGKRYDPLDALELFELASYFEPRYLDVVRLLTNNSSRYPTWLAVACSV